jgi:hypothetical protein
MIGIIRACSRDVAVVSLAGLSALHAMWATGSAWPAADRATLANAIGGFAVVPGPFACLAVTGALALATATVAGVPKGMPRTTRLGSVATALVLATRGAVGFAGLMPNGRRSPAFAALDRRVYSPVCLFIACAALLGGSLD